MDFLTKVFGGSAGWLGLVTITNGKRTEHWFDYPSESATIAEKLSEWSTARKTNVYFYPALYKFDDSSSVPVSLPVISADLDLVNPVLVTPRPDLIVESSRGRYQAYWRLQNRSSEFNPLAVGRITVDRRLRRLPGTKNWKYVDEVWPVQEVDPATLDDFPKAVRRRNLGGDNFDYMFRSGDLWSLAKLCARLGCTAIETYLVLQAAQDSTEVLPGDAGYALPESLFKQATDAVAANSIPSLLTEDEIRDCITNGRVDSFVTRYVEWASRRTDAPSQYHVVGALTVLSNLLDAHVTLATSHGNIRCNLWFMILGGTTNTRKTTAMEMAVKMARCMDNDIVVTTNGSAEGILSSLEGRDGQASLLHRDEVAGLLSETADKKYMSGALESLTQLYDGNSQRRTLSRRVIQVNDPYFSILCGGIKDRVAELLTIDHIESGFIPRFLVVCGWRRIEDMRPIGPPTEDIRWMQDKLIAYLSGLSERYSPPKRKVNGNGGSRPSGPLELKASDDAWERIQKLEADARKIGQDSESPDIFGPLFERCKNSILKVAVLLAADRAYLQELETAQVEAGDVIQAISYSSVWIESMYDLVRGIEGKPSPEEKRLTRITDYVRSLQAGVDRSTIMRKYRLNANEVGSIEATLLQRRQIVVSRPNGKRIVWQAAFEEEDER